MKETRGFVLINALILVAAISAASVYLLTRAESGRQRIGAAQQATQLGYLLDAYEALGMTLLDRDASGGNTDHLKESWAKAAYDVALDRGQVSGRLHDEQALFNVNWLVSAENELAQDAFDRLLKRLNLPPQLGSAIRDHIKNGGPTNRTAYAQMDPPTYPIGGALLMLGQLADIPGIRPEQLDTLRRFVTALPGDSAINLNTVSLDVLSAFLPQIRPAVLDSLLKARLQEPITSVDGFLAAVNLSADEDSEEEAPIDPDLFSVSSTWFRADITAALGTQTATRRVVFKRAPFPVGTSVLWRITEFP